jgi:hypothetical protein
MGSPGSQKTNKMNEKQTKNKQKTNKMNEKQTKNKHSSLRNNKLFDIKY